MTALNHALCPNPEHKQEEQQHTSADTSSRAQDTANHEVNLEPQRHHNQPVYDQCWAPILQPEWLLPLTGSAYNDQYQSHVGSLRISCHPEVVRGSYKGRGK
jgi:hypothetical protein